MPLVALDPLVPVLLVPLVVLLELPEALDGFAFVSSHLTPAGAELVDDVAPVVPVVPAVLDALPAGCRQPVTVTDLDELLLDDGLVDDVPLCA